MQNYVSKVLNISFGIFALVFLVTSLIFLVKGGVFPEGISGGGDAKNEFDVPMYFFKVTDRDRAYSKVIYDKKIARENGGGVLEVFFNSSAKKPVGVKTEAYSLDGLISIHFEAKASRDMALRMYLRGKDGNFLYYYPFEVTSEWKHYRIYLKDLKYERLPEGDPMSSPYISVNSFKPYIEWSYPPSEELVSGKFWMDNLEVDKK